MALDEVTIRELRNRGGEVVDRVAHGGRVVVIRDGRPVAELHPVGRPVLSRAALIELRAALPPVDPDALLRDVDAAVEGLTVVPVPHPDR